MAFAEDMTAFFDADLGFAVQATATTTAGAALSFLVIFDSAHLRVLGPGYMEASQPQILARTEDVSALTHGNPVVVGGRNWTVAEVQPDGTGLTTLLLESAS